MNMQALLKQAQKMQKEISQTELELKDKIYDSTVGGGVIKVSATGNMQLSSIEIDDSLLEKENKEDLEAMILIAINDVLAKAVEDKETIMNSLTSGVKMPGGF